MGLGKVQPTFITHIAEGLAPEDVEILMNAVRSNTLGGVPPHISNAVTSILDEYHKDDDPHSLSRNTRDDIFHLLRGIHREMVKVSSPPGAKRSPPTPTEPSVAASSGTLEVIDRDAAWQERMRALEEFLLPCINSTTVPQAREVLGSVFNNASRIAHIGGATQPEPPGYVGVMQDSLTAPQIADLSMCQNKSDGTGVAMYDDQMRSPVWERLHDVGLVRLALLLRNAPLSSLTIAQAGSMNLEKYYAQIACVQALPGMQNIQSLLSATPKYMTEDECVSWLCANMPVLIDVISAGAPPMSHAEVLERYFLAANYFRARITMPPQAFKNAFLSSIPELLSASEIQAIFPDLHRMFHTHDVRIGRDSHGQFFLCTRDRFEQSGLGNAPYYLAAGAQPSTTRERALCSGVSVEDCDAWVSGELPLESAMIERNKSIWWEGVDALRALMEKYTQNVSTAKSEQLLTQCIEILALIFGRYEWHFASPQASNQRRQNTIFLTAEASIVKFRDSKCDLDSADCTSLWRSISSILAVKDDADFARILVVALFLHAVKSERIETIQKAIVAFNDGIKTNREVNEYGVTYACMHLDRVLTRVPALSVAEMHSRVTLAASLIEYMFELAPHKHFLSPANKSSIAQSLFSRRLQSATFQEAQQLNSFNEICSIAGFTGADFANVEFLRAGDQLFYLVRVGQAPENRLLTLIPESDEEVTLDRVVAAHHDLDPAIEDERGKWQSGRVPSLREIETRLLGFTHVPELDGALVSEGEAGSRTSQRSGVRASGEQNDGAERHDQGAEKVRCIRDVLLRLALKSGTIGHGQSRAGAYACAADGSDERRFENGAGADGKTVIIVPDAAVTFIVFPDQKTRVVFNADMQANAFQSLSAEAIDAEYGKCEITYFNPEQFMRSVETSITSRLDPEARPIHYPLRSERNPSPLRRMAEDREGAHQFIYHIFCVLRDATESTSIQTLSLGAACKIPSGCTSLPLGSNNTGVIFLAHMYDELPDAVRGEVGALDKAIDTLHYNKAKAVFTWAKKIACAYEAQHHPDRAHVGGVQAGTADAIEQVVPPPPGTTEDA